MLITLLIYCTQSFTNLYLSYAHVINISIRNESHLGDLVSKLVWQEILP